MGLTTLEPRAAVRVEDTFAARLLAHATRAAERPALIDASTGRVARYGELAEGVEDLAGRLAFRGIAEGSCVVTLLPRSIAAVKTVLAASRVGAACLPYLSPRDMEQALASARRAARPALFVYPRGAAHLLRFARPGEVWVEYEELETGPRAPLEFEPTGGDVLYLNETSGSSGRPKIVPATHSAILHNTAACVEAFDLTDADVHLCTFASHAHELFARALYTGACAVLLPGAVADDPAGLLKALADYRVTCLMANTTVYATLVSLARDEMSRLCLRLAESGGIPTPEWLKEKVARRLGARLIPVWGSTETGGVAIATPLEGAHRPASVGRQLPGYRAEVVDGDGKAVKAGEYGELVVSGAGVGREYLAGDGDERLCDGVFRTGDIARIDADGWVYVRGRLANQFKVAGVAVNSEEVEATLRHAPHVKDVAVLPVPHPTLGYVPAALIVTQPCAGDAADERRLIKELLSAAGAQLPNPFFELPRHVKWISEALPLNSAGKLDRLAVRALYYDQPPRPTRVRLTRSAQLRLLMREIRGEAVWLLVRKHPLGALRLVWQLLKGDKVK